MQTSIGLLQLPWAAPDRPSIQLSLLKSLLEQAGFNSRLFYVNLDLVRALTPEVYEIINNKLGRLVGESFFANLLFGEEIDDYLEELSRQFGSSDFLDEARLNTLKEIREKILPSFVETTVDKILENLADPKIIGISCSHDQLLAGLVFSKEIKKRCPDCHIVLGGAQVSGVVLQQPGEQSKIQKIGQILLDQFWWLDWIVDGEGDLIVAPLFESLFKSGTWKGSHRGVITAEEPLENLDQLPIPDYSGYLQASPEQLCSSLTLPVEFSRGCWWYQSKGPCYFCGLCLEHKVYRRKSPKKIEEELKTQMSQSWILNFCATDTLLPESAVKALHKVRKSCDVKLFAEVRVSGSGQAGRLKNSGFTHVQPGIESFNDHLLELMNKGTKGIANLGFLKACAIGNINLSYNLLYGFPGEKDKNYRQMIDLLPLIYHFPTPLYLLKMNLQSHSIFVRDHISFGIKNLRPVDTYRFIFPFDQATRFKLAYLFDGDFERADPELINELHTGLVKWCRALSEGARLISTRGPDFLKIEDSRNIQAPRAMVLQGDLMTFMVACEVPVKKSALQKICGFSADKVTQLVARLVELELIIDMNDQVLGLPMPSQTPLFNQQIKITQRIEDGLVREVF